MLLVEVSFHLTYKALSVRSSIFLFGVSLFHRFVFSDNGGRYQLFESFIAGSIRQAFLNASLKTQLAIPLPSSPLIFVLPAYEPESTSLYSNGFRIKSGMTPKPEYVNRKLDKL